MGGNIIMSLKLAGFFFGCVFLFSNTVLQASSSLKSGGYNADTQKITQSRTSSINLHDAINKTFENNPALRSFSYALKAQGGKQLQASMANSPELSFVIEDAFGSGDFKGTDNAQATLSIAWVIEGEVRRGHMEVAQAGTASFSTQAKLKRLDAAAETARLYMVALAYQARLNNAIKTEELAKETVSAVEKHVAAGKAPEAELARARAAFSQQQLGYEDIEHELSSVFHLLAAQWGDTQPEFSRVEGDILNLPLVISFETLKTLLNRSPEFTRMMSDKRLMQAKLKLAQSQSASQWRVNLGIRHFETTDDKALVAGIAIPFGERSRNTGNIIEARENVSQILAKVDELKVKFYTALYVLSQELQHSLHRVTMYRSQIIPQLEKALNETRRAYDLGRYSYLEWRSVQADLLSARSALVESSINAHLKVIEIERLTGVPMEQVSAAQSAR